MVIRAATRAAPPGEDVKVQLYAGRISPRGQIESPLPLPMAHAKEMAPGRHLFVGQLDCRASGRQGYSIRIIPGADDLATPFEPGLIVWN